MIFVSRTISSKLKNYFYYKIIPKIVNLITALSVRYASKKIRSENIMMLLVDNTILAHSVIHETAWINTCKRQWGEHKIDIGYVARIPVHADFNDSNATRSVQYLPGIAYLARQGIITLVTSPELQDEQWTQPIGRFRGYGICDFSLFSDLQFETIKDPRYSMVMGPSYLGIPSLKDQRKTRLAVKAEIAKTETEKLYKSLLKILGQNNSQDAWHIATAEQNNCYCFLTMDFKLIRTVRSQSNNKIILSLKTKIMTPEEFGVEFKIIPIKPRFYSYHDADYPVRHDINWPDSKRQKPPKKKA